jgi:4-hydroxy-tetrahydrodipicolinate synthase
MTATRRELVGMTVAATAAASMLSAPARAATGKNLRDSLYVAAVTPVDANMKFDAAAYKDMLAFWKAEGADGVLVLGTTGEGQSFSNAERKAITEFSVKNSAGLDVIVGTGTANYPDTIELTKHAAAAGANSVLVVPPYYTKNPSSAQVLAYFDRVFAEVKTPVRYYHIPRVTGVPVTDMTMWKALTKYPNFFGAKDSNGDAAEMEAMAKEMPNVPTLTGTDPLIEQALGRGHGAILASGNLYTRQLAAVWKAYRAKADIKPALEKLKNAQALLRQPGYGQGANATKYALSVMLGGRQTFSRPPAGDDLSDAEKANIRKGVGQLKAMG